MHGSQGTPPCSSRKNTSSSDAFDWHLSKPGICAFWEEIRAPSRRFASAPRFPEHADSVFRQRICLIYNKICQFARFAMRATTAPGLLAPADSGHFLRAPSR